MVRKGKKANEPSLDDYWNEGADAGDAAAAAGSAPPAVEEEESVDLSKNKKKKKKNPVGLDDEEEVENRTMDPPGAKKKNAKKNGKVLDAAGSRKDDEETITTASVDDDEETAMELASMMKKKKPRKDKKKGFDDDAGDEAPVAAADIEDEEVLDLSAMKKKKPKKKEKKKADADLDDDEVPAAVSTVSPEDEEEMPDFSAMKKKKKNEKKDRKKFLEDEFDEGEVSIPASTASPDEEEEMPDFSTMKKKKKNAKKHVEEDDAEPEVTTSAASATKTEVPDEEEDLLDFSALKKKKPKKKEKKAADAEQNELEVPAADAGVPAAAAAASPDDDDEVLDLTGMKKKPKKKGKKKTVEDDYPEVAAQEWEVPTAESAKPEPAAAPKKDEVPVADSTAIPSSEADPAAPDEEEKLDLPGAKKKKSKKKKPGEKKSEDAAEATAASSASAEVSAASAASAPDTERDKKDETVPAKERETAETTTSSSSKKKKKKASAETQEPKPAKVVEKKVPKHVREMQERLAKMKEEEERRKREEEEKLRKEEEERLRLEEEERLREEAKQRRKQREKEKIKDKKAKGLYLTGKQKMEARRLAIIKEQILASNPNLAAGEEPSPTPRKPKYETKKKKVTSEDANAKEEETEKLAEDAEGGAEAAAAEEAEHEGSGEHEGNGEVDTAEAAAAAEAAEAAAEEDEEEEDDDWEAKSWDDESKLPTVKDAFADEDEEEEEQPVVVPEKPVRAAPKVAEQAPAAAPAPASAPVSREARMAEALSKRSASDLRSPICCILGHVDTGKTKLLDCIRRTNVQEGEAGGITQQIGATYFPMENIRERTKELPEAANMRVPGLLVIDTPGHESFTNLRSRGSGLCDIAILVIDIMHGLEPQTIESINLLKMRKTPFIVALNKVDRLYQWKSRYNAPIRTALQEQEKDTRSEFETRAKQIIMELQVQSLNSEIYWKNKDKRKTVSIVPTSAISGEGIPDLLYLLILLTQEMMEKKLMYVSEVQCTVLEVKVVEGLGTTIDVVLVNGVLHEGDQIVVCGMQGPIVTTIRALLTPHPMKELRVKGSYQHHKELKAAQGIKITAQGLEHAIAGTQLYIVGPDDDVDAIKEEAMKDVNSVMSRIDKSGEGVCVQASTLGSLEALLEFLKSPDVNIPVSGISIGPVHKKDIMRAGVMLERKKEYATILAFDVKVTSEARELAEETGVKIFTADIIYHLFDQFTAYLKNTREEKRRDTADEAIFPCILQILPNCVFNKKDPIIVGVTVLEGIAKVGTPICVHGKDGEFIDLGRIASLEINHKVVDVAKKGDEVAMKILGDENQKMFGRHFDYEDMLVSHITRRSIDILKENYRNELSPEEWKLIVKLKGIFKIT